MSKPILVIGATGTIGQQVVSQLLDAGTRVRAMSRNPGAANLPPNVDVVRGDLSDAASLESSLDGVETVFLVWTAPPAAAEAAINTIAKRARRIVYLSAPHKTPHPFFQQPNAVAAMHLNNERLIEASGLQWTFIRPGMFAANALGWWAPKIRAGEVVRWPYANAETAPIDERDIGAVAVRALLDEGHVGGDYVITGPESLTQREQVATIGNVLGRTIPFEEITPDDALRDLGFPLPAANMLLNAWAAAVGQPAFMTSTVEEITGTPARTFREWARGRAAEFAMP